MRRVRDLAVLDVRINHASALSLTVADDTSVEPLVVRTDSGDLVGVRVSFSRVLTIKTIKT